MDRMIYLSMSGARAMLDRQAVLANNLANVSTTGFRAELSAFRAVPVEGDGASTRVFALETSVGYDPSEGPTIPTGRNLDVAMKGNAWLALQSLNGTEAYTRAGALTVREDRTLVNHSGLVALGANGPIQVPADSEISIASDGTVSAVKGNAPAVVVGKLKLVTPAEPFQRGADGLFRTRDAAALPADPEAKLQGGALEGSNVSPVGGMVAMIAASRQFESQMKLLQTAESDEKAAAQLLSVG
ncbi:flagellar basal body rod protein FlgF [Piscinibacter sakaiensis]|uniref:flagellar basal body rod protein FlgF n=1 Tax=Piscinibacter sakaiensis TaxID=1547922 RepID=UPI003AAA7CE3